MKAIERLMRLWTLHPKYLDRMGLTAVWREGLLAQKVLSGKTKGYTRHPQLIRFRLSGRPLSAIAAYLKEVQAEAARRGYSFDRSKIRSVRFIGRIPVRRGQLKFEWGHLSSKLKARDRGKYRELRKVKRPAPHPLFITVDGGVEDWERGSTAAPMRRSRRSKEWK
jgi:hypothetical protein